jgi:hypothetical protein
MKSAGLEQLQFYTTAEVDIAGLLSLAGKEPNTRTAGVFVATGLVPGLADEQAAIVLSLFWGPPRNDRVEATSQIIVSSFSSEEEAPKLASKQPIGPILSRLGALFGPAIWHLSAQFSFTRDVAEPIIGLPMKDALPDTPFSEVVGVRMHAPEGPANPIGIAYSVAIDTSGEGLWLSATWSRQVDFENQEWLTEVVEQARNTAATAVDLESEE